MFIHITVVCILAVPLCWASMQCYGAEWPTVWGSQCCWCYQGIFSSG